MTSTLALSAPPAGAAFEKLTIERRELRPDDVFIDIKYVGICHSDLHQVNEDWGPAIFPMVPGHEITGVVAAVRNIVVKEHFVVSIPDAMGLAAAAPLLCAGITVYAPLVRFGAAGKNIAITGMGGLGHVAVKIAHALGATVTVLSQSLSKQEDGLAFGADHYCATSGPGTFAALKGSFDFILNTVSADLNLNDYLSTITINGSFINVGFPAEPYRLHASAFVLRQIAVVGSNAGGLPQTQRMLDFCAEHGIAAEIELTDADHVAEAYQRVASNAVRYRSVIDIAGTLVA